MLDSVTSPGAQQTAAAKAAAEVDDSVRCRMAEICEGSLACGRGEHACAGVAYKLQCRNTGRRQMTSKKLKRKTLGR